MVNLIVLERILSDIKSNVKQLHQAQDITWAVYKTDIRSRRFVERTLHILVEACIDTAQHIISDEGRREPTSYHDTFVVLAENGVITQNDLPMLENMVSFRNLIVHYYERVDDSIVFGIFKNNLSVFERFISKITEYLQQKKE